MKNWNVHRKGDSITGKFVLNKARILYITNTRTWVKPPFHRADRKLTVWQCRWPSPWSGIYTWRGSRGPGWSPAFGGAAPRSCWSTRSCRPPENGDTWRQKFMRFQLWCLFVIGHGSSSQWKRRILSKMRIWWLFMSICRQCFIAIFFCAPFE